MLQESYKGLLAAVIYARTRAADLVMKAVSALKGLLHTSGSKVTPASVVAASCALTLSTNQPIESRKHSNKVRGSPLCFPEFAAYGNTCFRRRLSRDLMSFSPKTLYEVACI